MPETTDSGSSRRGFLNWLLGTSTGALLASVFYPVARFISPPTIPEATTNQVQAGPTNDPEILERGYKILRFGSEPVILIRIAENDFRAFAATCTHLDCIVEFHRKEQRLWCNCHNGEYNLNGQQVAGPPPSPLQSFKVDLEFKGSGQPQQIVVSKV
jgi:Rieske Fe-S protein